MAGNLSNRRAGTKRGKSKPAKGLLGALDELGLVDPATGKRPRRKDAIRVAALTKGRRRS